MIGEFTHLEAIPEDWYPGWVPANILVGERVHIETSYSFVRYLSREPCGLRIGRGAALYAPVLDVGSAGRVSIGEFALVSSATIICDAEVVIGPKTMLAWSAVVLDTYRGLSPIAGTSLRASPRPVHIGANAWLGFECCVLPGVTIGDNSVIAARAVVAADVPANCVVAGNPARIVRRFENAKADRRDAILGPEASNRKSLKRTETS